MSFCPSGLKKTFLLLPFVFVLFRSDVKSSADFRFQLPLIAPTLLCRAITHRRPLVISWVPRQRAHGRGPPGVAAQLILSASRREMEKGRLRKPAALSSARLGLNLGESVAKVGNRFLLRSIHVSICGCCICERIHVFHLFLLFVLLLFNGSGYLVHHKSPKIKQILQV